MKLKLKEMIARLLGDRIHQKTISITARATSGMHLWDNIALGLPSNAKILSISIMRLPNPNWVYADIYDYSTSQVTIYYNNTYTGDIVETLELSVLYRL